MLEVLKIQENPQKELSYFALVLHEHLDQDAWLKTIVLETIVSK